MYFFCSLQKQRLQAIDLAALEPAALVIARVANPVSSLELDREL